MTTICLDNTFVSDYLDHEQYTKEFLSRFGPEDDVLLPDIVRFETLVPAYRSGQGRKPSRVRHALSGFQPVAFDSGVAEEAAEIRAGLMNQGRALGSPDILIAGTARYHGADVVTDDRAFGRVPGLTARNPKRDNQ